MTAGVHVGEGQHHQRKLIKQQPSQRPWSASAIRGMSPCLQSRTSQLLQAESESQSRLELLHNHFFLDGNAHFTSCVSAAKRMLEQVPDDSRRGKRRWYRQGKEEMVPTTPHRQGSSLRSRCLWRRATSRHGLSLQ